MITTDHFLKMGKDHNVCEDYIISGTDPFPYVILADGCSSSENTDIGARLLCLLAKKHLLPRFTDYYHLGNSVIESAKLIATMLGANKTCLYSTLIVSWLVDNLIHVYVYGDGNILATRKSGTVRNINISFTNNAPYYLAYWNNEKDIKEYKEWKTEKIVTDSPYGTEHYFPDSYTTYTFSLNEYKSILIASDGIETFNTDTNELISKLVQFKSTKNRFILRRTRKVLREYEKQGITHYDDLSIGGFYIGEES